MYRTCCKACQAIAMAMLLFLTNNLQAQIPVINSIQPSTAQAGSTVVLKGSNFNATPAQNAVYFGTVRAAVTEATDTSLSVVVPTANNGTLVSVTANGLTGYAQQPFHTALTHGSPGFRGNSLVLSNYIPTSTLRTAILLADMNGDGNLDVVTLAYSESRVAVLLKNNENNSELGFRAPTNLATQGEAELVQVGDLDGDGKLDIMIQSRTLGLSVYRNTTTGDSATFSARIDYPTVGIGARALPQPVDLNNDGKPDVVIVDNLSGIYLENQSTPGNINLTMVGRKTTSGNTWSTVVTDFDGDGKPDLVSGMAEREAMTFFLNSGVGTNFSFTTAIEKTTTAKAFRIASGDINGDNKPDIVMVQSDTLLSVLLNTSTPGNPSFEQVPVNFPRPTLMISEVKVQDLDGDGKAEIMFTSGGAVVVIKPIVNGNSVTFATAERYQPVTNTTHHILTIGDMNGDAYPDIIVTTASNEGFSFALFTNALLAPYIKEGYVASPTPGSEVTLKGGNFSTVTRVEVSRNNVNNFSIISDSIIRFPLPASYAGFVRVENNYGVDSVELAYPRIAVDSISPRTGPVGTKVTIYGRNFSTTDTAQVRFGPVSVKAIPKSDNSIEVAVPKGAGIQNVSVLTKKQTAEAPHPFILLPDSVKTVMTYEFLTFAGSVNPTVTYLHDLDGNGKTDIVSLQEDGGKMDIFRNATNGTFLLRLFDSIKLNVRYSYMALTDMDNDGRTDMLFVIIDSAFKYSLAISRNISTPDNIAFEPLVTLGATDVNVTEIRSTDLNNDGKNDVLLLHSDGKLSLFRNLTDPSGPITLSPVYVVPGSAKTGANTGSNLVTADLNLDGLPDIVVGNEKDTIRVWKNQSTNTQLSFVASAVPVAGDWPHFLAANDYDGDGKADLAVAYRNHNVVSVYRNTSNGDTVRFAPPLNFHDNNLNSEVLVAGDLNGDGKLDLFRHDSEVFGHIYINQSTPGNIAFSVTDSLRLSGRISVIADIDQDGRQDIVTAGGSHLTMNRIKGTFRLDSFSPKEGGNNTKITIKGTILNETRAVLIGGAPATKFTIVSDSVIEATVGTFNRDGYVRVTIHDAVDSLPGFTYKFPQVTGRIVNDSLPFVSMPGQNSTPKAMRVTANYLHVPEVLVESKGNTYVEFSRTEAGPYASSLRLYPTDFTMDSVIYVRTSTTLTNLRNDTILVVSGQTTGSRAEVSVPVVLNGGCDAALNATPVILPASSDTAGICFRDSVQLSVQGNYASYRWSNGDTASTTTVRNSGSYYVRVGASSSCLSKPSVPVKTIRSTDPVPSLALVSDTLLISSKAANYRWYFNNLLLTATDSTLSAKKAGIYAVETSSDKVCWDKSPDFPIIITSAPLPDSITVRAFPNPSPNGQFYVVATLARATNVVARVTVVDASGNVLTQTNRFIFFGREVKIPVTVNAKGTVFARVEINGEVKTQTVIIQ